MNDNINMKKCISRVNEWMFVSILISIASINFPETSFSIFYLFMYTKVIHQEQEQNNSS
jgi:hypothetical protein